MSSRTRGDDHQSSDDRRCFYWNGNGRVRPCPSFRTHTTVVAIQPPRHRYGGGTRNGNVRGMRAQETDSQLLAANWDNTRYCSSRRGREVAMKNDPRVSFVPVPTPANRRTHCTAARCRDTSGPCTVFGSLVPYVSVFTRTRTMHNRLLLLLPPLYPQFSPSVRGNDWWCCLSIAWTTTSLPVATALRGMKKIKRCARVVVVVPSSYYSVKSGPYSIPGKRAWARVAILILRGAQISTLCM
jgi:hypothetical protein